MSEKTLNPNAQLWVDALRSGKYKQCKSMLTNNAGHCCLGVACELYCEKVENIKHKAELHTTYGTAYLFLPEKSGVGYLDYTPMTKE